MAHSRFTACLLGASALALGLGRPASAQQVQAAAAPAGGTSNQPAAQLQEIVVTAQKRSEKVNDVPISIVTATGQDLIKRGITDPAQLEKLTPGFSYEKASYGTPVFTLRGVGLYDTSQGVTPAVAVYVDQIPLPFAPMTRGASLDVQRVEVLKGPQGTLFGENSTGGAMNYIAAKPTKDFTYGGVVDYGRFNAIDAEGYVSGSLTDNLRGRLAVRTEQQDAWQYSYTRGSQLGAKHYVAARTLLDWDPTSAVSFELSLDGWVDTSDTQAPQVRQFAFQSPNPATANPAAIAALTGYPLPPNDPRAADWDPNREFRQDNRFYQAALHGQVQLSRDLTLNSLTAYSHYQTTSLTEGDGTAFTSFDAAPVALLTSIFQELRLSSGAADDRIKWMVGGNYNHEIANEDQNDPVGGTAEIVAGIPYDSAESENHQKVDTWGVFGSGDIRLTDELTFQGSTRYTQESRDFVGCLRDGGDGSLALAMNALMQILSGRPGTAAPGGCVTFDTDFHAVLVHKTLNEDNVSWRGSLNWKPNRDLLTYVSISRGYKAGNFSTLPGLTPDQFDPLTQESVLDYEAGTKASLLHHRLQLNGAVFYYDYTNKQLLGMIQNPIFGTLPGAVSVPKSRILGWELEANWLPIEGLQVNAGVSYVNSKIEQDPALPIDPYGVERSFVGEQFPYTPMWQSDIDAEYRFPLNDRLHGFFGGNLNYRSHSYAQFGEDQLFLLDDRTLLDLRAGIDNGASGWRVQIFGHNVTNQKYYTQTARLTDTVISWTGMPVTYGIQLSYRH